MDNNARHIIDELQRERDALRRVVRAWAAWAEASTEEREGIAESAELELSMRALAELDAKR